MLLQKPKPFRQYVPLILNSRVVRWFFSEGEDKISIDIPMRHYPSGKSGAWIARQVAVHFDRRMKTHNPKHSHTVYGEKTVSVVETFYVCDNNAITFEEETIPVVQ